MRKLRHWIFIGLILGLCGTVWVVACSSDDEEEPCTNCGSGTDVEKAAELTTEEMTALSMQSADLMTSAVETASSDMLTAMLNPTRKADDFKSKKFTCDDGKNPEDKWSGYCYAEFEELSLGLQDVVSFPKQNFKGKVGYKSLKPDGVWIQMELTENVDTDPQEIYLNLFMDWVKKTGEEKSYVIVRSPKDVYSYVTQKDLSRWKKVCDAYLQNEALIADMATTIEDKTKETDNEKLKELQGKIDAQKALATFSQLCTLVKDIPEKSPLTTFMFIHQIKISQENYRGSAVLGKSKSNTDFRNNSNFMVVHWGYPESDDQKQSSPRTRLLVRFIGEYTPKDSGKGIPVSAPPPPENTEDKQLCYVIDLKNVNFQTMLVNAEKLKNGEMTLQEFQKALTEASQSIPTAPCPLACMTDAECQKGELCNASNECVPGCKSAEDCPVEAPTCCKPEEQTDEEAKARCTSTVAGAGMCEFAIDFECLESCETKDTCTTPGSVCFEKCCKLGCLSDDDCTSPLHCTEKNTGKLGSCKNECTKKEECRVEQSCDHNGMCVASCKKDEDCTTTGTYCYIEGGYCVPLCVKLPTDTCKKISNDLQCCTDVHKCFKTCETT